MSAGPARGSAAVDDGAVAAYLESVRRAFEEAGRRAEIIDRVYALAGHLVRVRFAGPALLPCVDPALAHLAASAGPLPSLTVFGWDSASTGVPLPPAPMLAAGEASRRRLSRSENDPIQTAFNAAANVLSMFDSRSRQGVFWAGDARHVPYGERAGALRVILHWWASQHSMQLVHGAAVGTAAGAVLIAGASGSGKSTTALACLGSDLRYIGDDYALVGLEPRAHVWSLYNTAKLDGDGLRRFPHLRGWVSNPESLDREKAVFFLQQHCPEKLVAGAPVRAIVSPRAGSGREPRLTRASGAQSLLALAPSTLFQLYGARHRSFALMSSFVRAVPGFVLELGADLSAIPGVLRTLVDPS